MQDEQNFYFLRRFESEVAAADAATCPQARVAHLELALRYSILAASADRQANATDTAPVRPGLLLSASCS